MTVVALVGLGVVGLLACQRGGSGDPPSGPPPGPAPGPPPVTSAAPADAAIIDGPPPPPRSPSTPPARTTRALSRRDLARLAAFTFDSFEREERALTDKLAEVRHTTVSRPKLGVVVTIEPCGACTPMMLDAWTAKGDEHKRFLSKELVARPDTHFEVGALDVSGVTAIYTYQLGSFFGKDDKDQPVGDYSDAYILYSNHGVNQIRVNAHYRDDALGSRDRLLQVAPPEDLEKLAVSFLRFYIHQWK